MRTYDVLVTQTTEDDLWSHFCKEFETFDSKIYKYYARLSDAVHYFVRKNPYLTFNWKDGPPKRKFKDFMDWFGDNENEITDYFRLSYLINDLRLCDKEFGWSSDEEYSSQYYDMFNEAEKYQHMIHDGLKDLENIEATRYNSAKKQWEEVNKDWIEEKNLKYTHDQFHKPKEYYTELIKNDKDAKAWYEERGIPNNEETCKHCMAQIKAKKEYEIKLKLEEEEVQRLIEETKAKEIQIIETVVQPTITYTCDECQYKTTSKSSFNYHEKSKDHKKLLRKKQLTCTVCDVFSRTEIEHEYHLKTKKHRQMTGEEVIEETEWKCDICNYKANLKHHLDNHLKSKRHQDKIALT
jgi:hypothetical protein